MKKDDGVTIHHRNIQSLAIELYKFKKGLSVNIMNDIFTDRNYCGPELRTQADFSIPLVKTVYKGDDWLRHLGPLIWKIVPQELKEAHTLEIFKCGIKKWIPKNCPCRLCKEYIQGLGYLN